MKWGDLPKWRGGRGDDLALVEHDVESSESQPEISDGFRGQVFEDGEGAWFVPTGDGLPFAGDDGCMIGQGAVPRNASLPLPELGGGDGYAVDD